MKFWVVFLMHKSQDPEAILRIFGPSAGPFDSKREAAATAKGIRQGVVRRGRSVGARWVVVEA